MIRATQKIGEIYVEAVEEHVHFSCLECGTKKNIILGLHEESNVKPSEFALQCHENDEQRFYKVYMTHASCIQLQ